MNDHISKIIDELVEGSFGIAQENINKDCNLTKATPAAYCISDATASGNPSPDNKDLFIMMPWEDDEQKSIMLQKIGERCYKDSISKIVLVIDSAMKTYEKEPDITTEQPLSYPESMRTDCFMVLFLDFKDSNENSLKAYPYKREKDNIIREEAICFDDSNSFSNSRIFEEMSIGFLKAGIFDEYEKKEILDSQFNNDVGNKILLGVLERYPGAALGKPLNI